METNKEIPTELGNIISKWAFHLKETAISEEDVLKEAIIEALQHYLSKQAEVIAEKADYIFEGNRDEYSYVGVDKQSILQASEEYIKNVK